MSDRFYQEQRKYKPNAYTKAMIIKDIEDLLNISLTKLQVAKKDELVLLRLAISSRMAN